MQGSGARLLQRVLLSSSSSASSSSGAAAELGPARGLLHLLASHSPSQQLEQQQPAASDVARSLSHALAGPSSRASFVPWHCTSPGAFKGFATQATPEQQAHPTPQPGNLLMRNLPAGWVPYAQLMRLDKPIGTWLLLLPSLWSIALATPPGQLPDLWMMTLFSVGAVLLRGAGCTINDLWDRDLDRRVERTRTRPLASGALQPRHAIGLLAAQLSLGLIILLQLNDYSKLLGATSLFLVATYPLMKRFMDWPQAYLGLTFNWGALLGYAAVAGHCDWAVVLPLYLAGVNWTLIYDTIYAHQDKNDDVAAGVRSTALTFGEHSKSYFAAFAAVQMVLLCTAGFGAGAGPAYYAGAAAMGGHLAWQIRSVDLDDGPDCMAKFVSNKWAGMALLGGIVGDKLMMM